MTFEEWYSQSGWAARHCDLLSLDDADSAKYIMEVAWNASRRNTIEECYGKASVELVLRNLESLRKASNRPVEPFSSTTQGGGSLKPSEAPCSGCAKDTLAECSYRCK